MAIPLTSDDQTTTQTQTFPRSCRLTLATEYDRVYEYNAHAADEVLVIVGGWNQLDVARLGLSVSRKVGNAVIRNRWKRWIREAFRVHRQQLPVGIDYVVRPRKGAVPSYAAIHASLPRLAQRVCNRLSQPDKSPPS